jgi:tetratricopeptide (TPR) repeat protein
MMMTGAARTVRDIINALICVLIIFCGFMTGCSFSSQKIEITRAEKAEQAGRPDEALAHYRKVMNHGLQSDVGLQAAKQAARIAYFELKNFSQAIELYKQLVLYAPDPATRIDAQKNIAEIHFKHLTDYRQAVLEYNRLLELPHMKEDGFKYRLAVAHSYFYMNNFYQALVEIDAILTKGFPEELLYEPLLVKANIFLNTNRLDEAIKVLQELLNRYPERSKKETVGLQLAVCYEEKKDYAKAVETLETVKVTYPTPEFIEMRIRRLKERQSYQPGAKGLKK